ncbi:MAG TPA: SH3-like domain-containing protein [Alphaproteobacteria bacterium]|nr:SH3-like domain-containing protein [Alphaproteobacteria bacterium]
MKVKSGAPAKRLRGIVKATGEEPAFNVGDTVKVLTRTPVGHYRVPLSIRGKHGSVEAVIRPKGIDNEVEAYGRNAGVKGHYYRIAIPLAEIWPAYTGSPKDGLRIEVFETWLERI